MTIRDKKKKKKKKTGTLYSRISFK